MNDLLCGSGTCEETTSTGDLIRPDHLHFSSAGSAFVAPRLSTAIEQALTQWYAKHPH